MRFSPFTIAGLCVALALTACESDLLTVDRDFAAPTLAFEVPARSFGGSADIVMRDYELGLDEALDDFGLARADVESIRLSAASALIDDPSGEFTFADLERGELWLDPPGEEPVLVAFVPEGAAGATVELSLTDLELVGLLGDDDEVDAILRVEVSDAPGEGVSVALALTFGVVGGV